MAPSLLVTATVQVVAMGSAFRVAGSLNGDSAAFYCRQPLRYSAKGGTLAYSTELMLQLGLRQLAY